MWKSHKDLLRLRRKLNAHPTAELYEGKKPIEETTSKGIRKEIKWWLGELLKIMGPERWEAELPPEAISLYKMMRGETDGHLFFKVPRFLINDLDELTAPEWYILTFLATFAHFGKGEVEHKTVSGKTFTVYPGETFVGREKIAGLSGYSVASVDRIIASLEKKHHLTSRWVGRNKVVRKVEFMGYCIENY